MATRWTPEARQQQAQAIQAWKPWEHASGPRTIEGKAKASRNAYKGGNRALLRALAATLRDAAGVR